MRLQKLDEETNEKNASILFFWTSTVFDCSIYKGKFVLMTFKSILAFRLCLLEWKNAHLSAAGIRLQ